jgi:hypothetical protein
MILQIEFWQLAGMLGGLGVAIISCVIVLARWLAAEYDRRQGQRLDMFEEAAKLAAVAHTEALGKHVQEGAQEVARISGHAERIARLEEAIQRSPSHDDLRGVYVRLNDISSKTDTMQGQLPGLIDNVRMILHILKPTSRS